ncbi:MAG: outer membrane protein assembly factor BamB family protein, partial [Planctomycetota bacterium]
MKKTRVLFFLIACCCVVVLLVVQARKVNEPRPPADTSREPSPEPAADQFMVNGRPLDFWVSSVSGDLSAEDLNATVEALSSALSADDLRVRVSAADALAVLGPQAKVAVPALIEQLSHIQPWVRVAAMGALAAVGKDAVPALIETFQTGEPGPRARAAFVLGGIGPDAKDAAPILEEAMREASGIVRDRFLGILGQIDPEKYASSAVTPKAQFDAAEAGRPEELAFDEVATLDWPQFHGPGRDSLCRERGLLDTWPEQGPRLLWQLEGLGVGFSNVSIADGRLFTMGDRPSEDGSELQFVTAHDLTTRELLWATQVGPPHQDGPRCTPTVDGELVYAISTEGALVCLEAADGTIRWQKSMPNDFGGKMMSRWPFSESPLVDGDKVICTPGGEEATMVGLNKLNGDTVWTCAVPELGEKGVDGAAYSSAVVAEIAGVRQYVQLLGRGVIGVDEQTGRFLWGYNGIANTVANIPTPIVRGSYVFVTTAYNTGAALLKIVREGDNFEAREV